MAILRRIFAVLPWLLLLVVVYVILLITYIYVTFDTPVRLPFYGPQVFVFIAVLTVIGTPLYLLPAIIGRQKRNARALFVLNLFLGWTFLGWMGALIWALLRDSTPTEPTVS